MSPFRAAPLTGRQKHETCGAGRVTFSKSFRVSRVTWSATEGSSILGVGEGMLQARHPGWQLSTGKHRSARKNRPQTWRLGSVYLLGTGLCQRAGGPTRLTTASSARWRLLGVADREALVARFC